jgi:hypothetical protein
MSLGRLKNPLDSFTTYSSHFVLLAARTTERARLFSDDSNATSTLQAIDSVKQLGAPVPFPGTSGDVFLVLDTRRFAQFSVERMKYETFINGLTTGQSHANLSTEIEMTILDSVGISFINYLQWLMDTQMQTNFDGMVFMLRVIFVGHKEDGSTETVQTVTIPCHLFKMDVDLDYAKGAYSCSFMPNFNFASNQHSRWLNIGQASNYFTGSSNKLGDMVNSFERTLNTESQVFYDRVEKVLLSAGKAPSTATGRFGRKVQYQLTLPKEWNDFIYTGPSIHDAVELDFKARSKSTATGGSTTSATGTNSKEVTQAKNTHLSVDPGQTIPEVLDIMFKQVADIQRLGNAEKLTKSDQFITFYKYLTSVSSDDSSFTVHVDVIPFEIPNVKPPSPNQKDGVSQHQDKFYQQVDGKNYPRSYFELDYIFTGKNVDVLGMEMKIQDLQFLLAANVKVGEGEQLLLSSRGQGDTVAEKKEKDPVAEVLGSSRAYDPIMIPMLTQAQRDNFSQYVLARSTDAGRQRNFDSQSYSRNLSAFYAQSAAMANITIRGNPDIMAKFVIESPVQHTSPVTAGATGVSTTNLDVKSRYRDDLEKRILRTKGITEGRTTGTFSVERPLGDVSYVSQPVFVLLNVMGPNVDPITNELIQGEDFATRVLYDNYYVVFRVVNIIERGVFTQELELWSHNVYGTSKLTSEDRSKKATQVVPS